MGGVCEIVYCQYILWGNSSRGVYKLVSRCLRTRIPVFVKSYTGMRVYNFKTPVYEFTDTGIRVRRHRYTSSQTPVYEFIDTGIRVHRHRYTSSRHRYTSSQTPEARVICNFG